MRATLPGLLLSVPYLVSEERSPAPDTCRYMADTMSIAGHSGTRGMGNVRSKVWLPSVRICSSETATVAFSIPLFCFGLLAAVPVLLYMSLT
jgi:hypothetical protein